VASYEGAKNIHLVSAAFHFHTVMIWSEMPAFGALRLPNRSTGTITAGELLPTRFQLVTNDWTGAVCA